jgi:CheY-like chemotaxis protein
LEQVQASPPDVVLSDIGMPEQDGYELIRKIRNLPHDKGGLIPAAALTAFARSEDRTKALLAGFQMHVSKPVEPSELIATVASLAGLTGRSSESGLDPWRRLQPDSQAPVNAKTDEPGHPNQGFVRR